jgi:hypothetical protein
VEHLPHKHEAEFKPQYHHHQKKKKNLKDININSLGYFTITFVQYRL